MCTVHCALHTPNIANLHRVCSQNLHSVRSAKFTQCTGSAKFAQCTHSSKFIHSTHWILQIYTVYTQCIIYTVNAQCKINTGYAQCKCIIERKSHYLPCLLNRRSSTHLDLPDLNCIVLCAWLENQKPAVKACQLAPISKCNGGAFSISITIKCSILHPSPSPHPHPTPIWATFSPLFFRKKYPFSITVLHPSNTCHYFPTPPALRTKIQLKKHLPLTEGNLNALNVDWSCPICACVFSE